MLAAERRSIIAHRVRSAGAMSTEGLAAELAVSSETIRRDLLRLEREGLLARVHGGATVSDAPPELSIEPHFDVRSSVDTQGKQAIARAAAERVPHGGVAMIDVGTTALLVARALPPALECTVVTTSLRVASELADHPGIDLITPGGRVRSGDLALFGSTTAEFLRGLHCDVAFLGSGGLDRETGLSDFHLEEAEARRTLIRQTRAPYVLCHSSKFDVVAPYRVAGLDDLSHVITDRAPDAPLAEALDASGVEIVIAPER